MREILRLRELRPGCLSKFDLMKFEKSLKGLKIEPTLRQGVVRRFKVMGISRTPANQTFFDGENGRISVDDYFFGNYYVTKLY